MLNEWLTCEDLCNRWNINKYTVADMVNEGKLRTYDADFTSYTALGNGEWLEEPQHGDPGMIHMSPISADEITTYIFRRSHVEEYETRNGIVPHNQSESSKKLTAKQISARAKRKILKEEVRKVSEKRWGKDPSITKVDMAMRDEISKIKGASDVAPQTIERWIADLNPNRKPGRRPKKTQQINSGISSE